MTTVPLDEPPPWAGWAHREGTVAVVTGAGSGIGQATSILAAQQGLHVAAWDVRREGIDATLARAGDVRGRIHGVLATSPTPQRSAAQWRRPSRRSACRCCS